MFSSTPSSNSYFDHEKDDAFFIYNQSNNDPFISGDCFLDSYNNLAPPSPLVMENIATIKQDFVRQQQQQLYEGSGLQYSEDHDDLLDSVISGSKKKMATSKKDGHSKIYTARGLRDRRVRLSIEIATKFFSLQDSLGFDKASKTLDWLFTKSKTAIKELVEETKQCSSRSSTVTEVSFLEAINGGSDEDDEGQKKKIEVKSVVDDKTKKMTRKSKGGFQANLARDRSRAEAKARARERTREKKRIKKLDDELRTLLVPGDSKDITWESIMDRETLEQSKDSSFQIKYNDLQRFGELYEHQGDHAIIDLDL